MGTAQTVFEGVLWGATGSDRVRMRDRKLHHGCDVTGNDVTGTGSREPEMKGRLISRVLPVLPGISRLFPGTPLDSRYEQWNCESNLYRVTIALLPLC